MNLLSYRSFSTELLKIANDLGDADIRALLAERQGKEYLKGGQLDTNKLVPADRPVPAGDGGALKIANYTLVAPSMLKVQRKEEGPYSAIRNTAVKGLGGAFAGAGAVKLYREMAGRSATPHSIRLGAGVGAGLSLADKYYRHRNEMKALKQKPKTKIALVQQNANAPFRSPGDALATSQNVGKFQNRVHQSQAKVPGLLGKEFRSHTL